MGDRKKETLKAFSKEFPTTKEGLGRELHGYLYLKYFNLYIHKMLAAINQFTPHPKELVRPDGEGYDEVEQVVQLAVNYSNKTASKMETNGYHAKVLRVEDAVKILALEGDLNLSELPKTVIPYERACQALIKNADHLVVIDCPCRVSRGEKGCYPRDVCILLGDPWGDFLLEHNKESHPRRITQEEALEIVRSQHELGHIQAAFFKDACGDRLYGLCNCCECCCVALTAYNYTKTPIFANSGYIRNVDPDKCISCGACVENCKFLVPSLLDKKMIFDQARCMGCGVCVDRCPVDAIKLERADSTVSEPFDLDVLIPKYSKKDTAE